MRMKKILLAGAFLIGSAVSAAAATVTLDFTGISSGTNVALGGGFVADNLRIVNGNCDSPSASPCAALNRNQVTVISRSAGDAFTLSSYWYQLLGNKTELLVEFLDSMGGVLAFDAYSDPVDGNNDGGQVVAGSFVAPIYGIRFSEPGPNSGNTRFDDIVLSYDAAVVPVPAAGLLMLSALGGAFALRRRKA